MLSNLGFKNNAEDRDDVLDFQSEFGLSQTGKHPDIASQLETWHQTGDRRKAGLELSDEDDVEEFVPEEQISDSVDIHALDEEMIRDEADLLGTDDTEGDDL